MVPAGGDEEGGLGVGREDSMGPSPEMRMARAGSMAEDGAQAGGPPRGARRDGRRLDIYARPSEGSNGGFKVTAGAI
jgi:hypothetical protein